MRSVVIFAPRGVEAIDVVGPFEVFGATNRALIHRGQPPCYQPRIVAERKGPFHAASGLQMVADQGVDGTLEAIDTLIVTGALDFDTRTFAPEVVRWVQTHAVRARRVVSICTGAFLLAEAGLLRNRRAATHWLRAEALAERHPDVEVDSDAIFIRDGHVWTSAGATAGMDLTLSLVRDDLGSDIAHLVAQVLVMYVHRPGGQSQFSAAMVQAPAEDRRIREVQTYVLEHPSADLRVPALAKRAGMSPRNFARVFSAETGNSIGSFVAHARLEAAKRMLENGGLGLEEVAARCGYGSTETLRRAFHRRVGSTPSDYRERFGGS